MDIRNLPNHVISCAAAGAGAWQFYSTTSKLSPVALLTVRLWDMCLKRRTSEQRSPIRLPSLAKFHTHKKISSRFSKFEHKHDSDIIDISITRNTEVHNSKLAINQAIPDVLYTIFTLAIYDSIRPMRSVLTISHVCRHWRESALGWPGLWRFIDLDASDPIIDLFMSRSANAPLILSWTTQTRHWHRRAAANLRIGNPSMLYLESRANSILPRLSSLTLHLLDSKLAQIKHVFQNSELPPLQLRRLDIELRPNTSRKRINLTDFLRVDLSYLRELKLRGMDLPWLELPHDKLTHFKLSLPFNPPTLSDLVRFLSNCPLLCELEFRISDLDNVTTVTTASISTTQPLDFPSLKRLILSSEGESSYDYIHKLSSRIRTLTSLSEFHLSYNNRSDLRPTTAHTPFDIFGAVPSGIYSHFIGYHYLYINIDLDVRIFEVSSAPDRVSNPLDCPLRISGSFPQLEGPELLDHLTPILDFILTIPHATHLTVCSQAWDVLTPWIIDFPNALPWLHTLELSQYHAHENHITVAPSNFILRRLILSNTIVSSARLLSIVSRTGATVVELDNYYKNHINKTDFRNIIAALDQRGVVVVPVGRNLDEVALLDLGLFTNERCFL